MRVNGPGQSAHLLLDVLDVVTGLGIQHAVIGAFAVSYHGIPRSTVDADAAIWLAGTGRTDKEVVNSLHSAGYEVELRRADDEDPIRGVIVVQDAFQNRVDLVLGIRGMDPDLFGRCVTSPLLDSAIHIAGLEDLVAMKLFAGGVQDRQDVQGIHDVSGHLLNHELLRRLARGYGNDVERAAVKLLES